MTSVLLAEDDVDQFPGICLNKHNISVHLSIVELSGFIDVFRNISVTVFLLKNVA